MEQYICYENYPVGNLKPASIFQKLSDENAQYAAHLSLAAYASFPVLAAQISHEALDIHTYLFSVFKLFSEKKLKYSDFSQDKTFKQLCEYAAQFYYQGGNYQGYGDKKFVPRSSYDELVILTKKISSDSVKHLEVIQKSLYSLQENEKMIGFPPHGQTQYYTNVGEADGVEIDKLHGLMVENTGIAEENGKYVLNVASVDKSLKATGKEFNGKEIVISKGLYSQYLQKVIQHLNNAQQHCSELEKKMINQLIQFYQTGDMDRHLDYSRHWVENSEPIIETYQGFIESYRDPRGVRAEMEAFVAVVDPVTSATLKKLLNASKQVLDTLPVPQFLHRETFVPPSYKAIDIVTFVCSGMPIGINIPNYDAIRNGFGYKNVTLQNVISARQQKAKDLQYVDEALKERIIGQQKMCTDAEVALHELFGHGSCRLIYEKDLPQLQQSDKELLAGFYKEGQTFYATFASLQSAFEECRAEVTAHYLNDMRLVREIFGVTNDRDYTLCSVYSMALAGILGLMQYDDGQQRWLQAHSQANHLILRNVLKRTDAVQIELTASGLCIKFDESKSAQVVEAHGELVRQLNVIKAGADQAAGNQLFAELSAVEGVWLKVRAAALAGKKPRTVMIPARIVGSESGKWTICDCEVQEGAEAFAAAENFVWNLIQAGL